MADAVSNAGQSAKSKGSKKRRGSTSVFVEPRLEVSLMNPEKAVGMIRRINERSKEAVRKSQVVSLNDTIRRMASMRQTIKTSANVLETIDKAIASIRTNGSTGFDRLENLLVKRQCESFHRELHTKRLKRRHLIRQKIDVLKAKIAEREASTADDERSKLWRMIVRKQIPKAAKQMTSSSAAKLFNAKRVASVCSRETKRLWIRQNRLAKDSTVRARKAMREMLGFWKKNEREEKELRKRAEKEAIEQRRLEEEKREAKRQAKKLNFLLTQTELFTHFIAGKTSTTKPSSTSPIVATNVTAGIDFADIDDEALKAKAEQVAKAAFERNREKLQGFQAGEEVADKLDLSKAEHSLSVLQPRMLQAQLKEYQLKGLGWLANLYEQGINGILADEMGLGKTIQAISLLAHLAESNGIWGPFLVVAPASTLHNWQQELARFVPAFKVLPYWGNVNDRKTLRKFWPSSSKRPFTRDSTFHIMVTSYQLVVTDQAFLQKIRWQYMVLDEAQAIKSSASQRWKVLLGFPCRNRLLLTGTPIQNTMQELWALLHFIMPSLFDSHDEFSDWFSKDIESTAAAGGENAAKASLSGGFDQHQLARLHMLLKPFMLRRVKKDVQSELAPKVEIEVSCDLAPRQRRLYRAIKQRLPIDEILRSAAQSDADASASLMNIMMQFRKVCNHPELFERESITSPFLWHQLGAISPKEEKSSAGLLLWPGPLGNPLEPTSIPRLVWRDRIQTGVKFDIFPSTDSSLIVFKEPGIAFEEDLVPLSIRYLEQREPRCFVPAVVAPPAVPLASPRPLPAFAPYITGGDQILMPDFSQSILGSGKMAKLDELLVKLKAEGHRVLIYNQMTRMIDLMEEYLQFRGYRYLRLDGSTKIADRRDMVNDWQSNPDIFVFLLSTRAGGLGINLTAADTVIFYDSDWNPTVDQQAMDRAHRLGQTRQVTVYRLVTKGSVEERIQQRAKQKDLVQKVVIAGGDFDAAGGEGAAGPLKAKDIASLLLDDEE